jgi:tetraacyldisaccharide 4'-kinase
LILSSIYGRIAALRRSWYEGRPAARKRLTRPVISVGNLVVGGSGKTPIVAAISRLLLDLGERPAILTRGYGRRRVSDGVVVVSNGRSILTTVSESGDEPQMLARALPSVPVLVSADRYLAGRLAEQRFGATVHLLDDAFQHVQLDRAIDLLVVSAEDIAEKVLPSGRLREPLAAARSADAVLAYTTAEEAQQMAVSLGVATSFAVATHYGAVRSIAGSPVTPSDRRVAAVAGIARPTRFVAALPPQGYDVVRELMFRDHHWFTLADIARIEAAAQDAHAALVVTTEKDAVRLEGFALSARWAVLPMEVTLDRSFTVWLESRLRSGLRQEPACAKAAAGGQVA